MLNHDRPPVQGEQPKGGAGDSGAARSKPDPMRGASLRERLRAMGAVRTKQQSSESVEWVNAPLDVVVDQAYLAASGRITDVTRYDEDTLRKVDDALAEAGVTGVRRRQGVISAMQNVGILFRERVPDAEEHTHHTREARDQCAAGDHKYAVLLDDAAEREKLRELIDRPQGETPYFDGTDPEGKPVSGTWTGETTMAEEPIENRLRRAWLNGFKDGVERAAYATTESTGRWDY